LLTEQQQKVLDEMLSYIERKENYFLSSEDRAIGKTFTLNELAFTLQALGYKVFVLTPYKECEYFADRFISLDLQSYRGRFANNAVIIADEARFEMMEEFLDYCKYRSIPVVGYVNFRRSKILKPIQFKREYECTWIK
jgi:hypothetical protein